MPTHQAVRLGALFTSGRTFHERSKEKATNAMSTIGPTKKGAADEHREAVTPPQPGVIRMLAESSRADPAVLPYLFRLLAQEVRSRVLQVDDADLIAGWFDRIAAGESPADVLPHKPPGRPRKVTAPRKPMGDGRIPDDYDVAHIVHQNVSAGMKRSEVCRKVAKALGMREGTVRNIYSRLRTEMKILHRN